MLPPAILDIAHRSQVGLISNRAVLRAGFHAWDLTEWVRNGLLTRLLPGWYVIAGAPVPDLQSLFLAQQYLARRQRNCGAADSSDPQSLISFEGAAYLLGATTFQPPFRAHALIDHGRRVRLAEAPFDVTRAHLDRIGWRRHLGLYVPDPCRILLDLADVQTITLRDLRVAGRDILRACRLTSVDLDAALVGATGEGAQRLRGLLVAGAFDVESEMEWQMLSSLFADHPPAPDCQVWVSPRWRVDFVYLFSGLILEYYGEDAHRNRVDDDGSRVFGLRELGFEILVVTKSMMKDRPRLAAHIHDVRRHREEEMRAGHLPRPALPRQPERRLPLRTLGPLG